MRADVIQRVANVWGDYQNFLKMKIGDHPLKKLLEETPDKNTQKKTLKMLCGRKEPPFPDRNCSLLNWEIEKGRWTNK